MNDAPRPDEYRLREELEQLRQQVMAGKETLRRVAEEACKDHLATEALLAAERAECKRLRVVADAAKAVLSVAYVGNGKVVCPPAFLGPLRSLAAALATGPDEPLPSKTPTLPPGESAKKTAG